MTDLYLGLGSNVGDRHALLSRAVSLLAERVGQVCSCSDIIETEPWGYASDNAYLNAVAYLRTELSATEVLCCTEAIERELGRTVKTAEGAAYCDRTIDIDVLLYGNTVIYSPSLRVPHPRMWQRDFVLSPLAQVVGQAGGDAGRVTSERCATIGFFDGVHLGHRHLLSLLCSEARERGQQPLAITFDRHPRTLFDPSPTPLLTPPDVRLQLLGTAGVEVAQLQFDACMASLSARQFMQLILREQLNVSTLLVGYDHRFGRPDPSRRETIDDYRAYGREIGIDVVVATEFSASEPTVQHISSSAVRRALGAGDVASAVAMLGRPYEWVGRVVHGHAIGRSLGFPTANLEALCPAQMLPACGVYAVMAGDTPAMLNIGTRPTISSDDHEVSVEAHLIDYSGDLYGHNIAIRFYDRLRDERRFDSEDVLRQQLEEDRATVKKLLQGIL